MQILAIAYSVSIIQNAMANLSYRPQSEDTSVEADRFAFRLLRQKSNCDRIAMSAVLSRGDRELSLMDLKSKYLCNDVYRLDSGIQGVSATFLCN